MAYPIWSVSGQVMQQTLRLKKKLSLPGTLKYGQCTRYLAGLKVGQKVTVSIKPSVMKVRIIYRNERHFLIIQL